jgi:hypothetical protein
MRKQSEAQPEQLTLVPYEQWPARRPGTMEFPIALWRSRHYLVQKYEASSPAADVVALRLSVNRVTMGADGRWVDGLSWEELMRCKRECGYGEWYAVEVYPRDRDIVNDANMRHLWLFSEPLPVGWF